jgi:hypothetical protein
MLALLSGTEPDFAEFMASPQAYDINIQTGLYLKAGCRWVSLTMYPSLRAEGQCAVVVFGRASDEDKIEVQAWEVLPGLPAEGPRPEDPKHVKTERFEPGDLMTASNHVRRWLGIAYRGMRFTRGVAGDLSQT